MLTPKERDALLIRIDERLEHVGAALARDYQALYGNGRPGLVERVRELEARRDQSDRFGRKYGALVAWCITTIIAAYAAWKNH